MPYAKAADGTRIAYQSAGAGPPLLLLTGQANNHHWWEGIRTDFETGYRTISLDYRGTGDSDKPDIPYSTLGFAEDAIAVLDELGIEKTAVYGTSMGGRVGQWLAARFPDRVHTLVLGCTSPGGRHAVERDAEVRKSLVQPDPAAARRALLELMYTPEYLASTAGPFNTLGDPAMPAYAKRRHLYASNKHDAWDVLADIAAPTLIVHGSEDRFNPAANAPLLANRIPGARLAWIPGARHAYFDEFRSTASPLVLEFLDANRP